ncbi:2,3-diaminopropionate biosynthesis protein SbnA [Mesonia sp. MT50]|uniref:N-(2-amino-2-carboxyethyl)-L-glutamate synthase n=1 Tax=Mesonia profundi TaxID=3070998 RepID=A0ABU1A2C6_9FLAO|nr:2,3-diaminopropionate biosynthesis protein SbnA [Mesonia profundi]MDQ7917854.1 2,3-diaminopropionate biosynthesis protein SbnA [Mesonia profundi]
MISITKSKTSSEYQVAKSILEVIGSTPLVNFSRISKETGLSVYGKLESSNPGGSIKDRTAYSIISKGLSEGSINADSTLVESSSGNMAIGLAQVCSYFKLPLIIVVDTKANIHTLKILKAYGVQIEKVSEPFESGGFLAARLKRVQQLLDNNPKAVWTNQYGNEANPIAHHKTMHEISNTQVGQFDYVMIATSTCGTLMGCADYIKRHNLSTKLIAVDAEGSVIFGQNSEKRLIPGHGAGLPSQFLKKNDVDGVVHVNDWDCVKGCHILLREESIMAGGSSGAIVSALFKITPQLPKESKIALIICDRGERYIETIYNPKWRKEHFGKIYV